ncbi:MAG: hypothetical protein QM765_28760 [Myxococcales bacterium]
MSGWPSRGAPSRSTGELRVGSPALTIAAEADAARRFHSGAAGAAKPGSAALECASKPWACHAASAPTVPSHLPPAASQTL